ncbi:MAG: MFS transporter, partial [Actinomycetota bacterium]|nr:MFS transporter [Actinomycetota bacterium]
MTPPLKSQRARLSRRGPLLLILFAALSAGTGNGISIVVFPWLVLQRTGSALDASIVAMAGTLPLLAATLIAGAAVDYLGRRRVSMISDALSALSVATVPVLALVFGADAVNVATLAALAALGALFDPAGMTARETMLPEAAARAGWSLDHANSYFEAVFNLAYIVGPGIGGLLIATLGGINTMWVTAATFLASILAISVLRLEGAGIPDRSALTGNVWAGILEGLRFVWHNKVLRTLAFVDLVATGLYMPMESVLFPKYFTDRNEPAHLGWVLMALSIGGLLGALGYAVISRFMKRRTVMLIAVLTLGAAMTVIAFLPPLPVILVLCAVVGFVYGPIAPIYNYVMQTRAPAHLRGRVVGVMGSLAYAAGPLGLILAGPLADSA